MSNFSFILDAVSPVVVLVPVLLLVVVIAMVVFGILWLIAYRKKKNQ